MSNVTCPNCGAALIGGAKFCRQCGRLVSTTNAPSVTEATTRTLLTPAEFGAQPTDFLYQQPTSPAYLSPTEMPPPLAYDTSHLKSGRKPNVWLLGAIVALVLLASIALGIVALIKGRTPATTGPGTIPPPPAVTAPGVPPPPPEPRSPTPTTGANPISSEFVYPGAETMMDIKGKKGNSILQLRTKDSFAKVLDWYLAKLGPGEVIKPTPFNAILKSGQVMAIITGEGGETNIMLQQRAETDTEEDN